MQITYIGEELRKEFHAGSKARCDVERILYERYGNAVLAYSNRDCTNFLDRSFRDICNYISILQIKMCKGKNLCIQYPISAKRNVVKAVYSIIDKNNCIAYVHDIDFLRSLNEGYVSEEISLLNKFKAVILHNDYMKKALVSNGLRTNVYVLKIFDYLLKNEKLPKLNSEYGNSVVFAGNLEKSQFLVCPEFENISTEFNLFGPGINEKIESYSNVRYHGSLHPDEVPYKLKGSFGLIWDGTSLDGCIGPNGNYMRYNNPHKLSLYIASGLPVIVWEEAAVAAFVREHNIGLVVKSLRGIRREIEKIGLEGYEILLKNVHIEQEKLTKGFYTNKVLDVIEKDLLSGKL